MKIFILLLLVNGWPIVNYGQYGNVWTQLGLDFNTFPPKFVFNKIYFEAGPIYWEANSTVSDGKGRMLFYTNGVRVLNRDLEIMPNGFNLIDITADAPNPAGSTMEGTLIVPLINEDSLFYVFSMGSSTGGGGLHMGMLYHSTVDIRLDKGKGDVVPNKKGILMNKGPFSEGMICVPGNQCNAWLIVRHQLTGDFHAYEITEQGVNTTPVLSTIDEMVPCLLNSFRYNVNKRKILMTHLNYTLLDFDPNTGKISRPINLVKINSSSFSTGYDRIAFDSSGRYVFYSDYNDKKGYRVDISVDHPDSIRQNREKLPYDSLSFLLGPDKRLYYSKGGFDSYIGNIPDPADSINKLEFNHIFSGTAGDPSLLLGLFITRNNTEIIKIKTNDPVFSSYTALENPSCFGLGNTQLAIKNENPWKIEWSNGATDSFITVTKPGKYWVKYRLSPCEEHIDTFEVTYTYPPLPNMEIIPSCFGQDNGMARFVIGRYDSTDYSFVWIKGLKDTVGVGPELKELAPGKYEVRVRQDTCFTTVDVVVPEVTEKVSWTLSDTLICVNESIVMQMDSGYFYRAVWSLDGTPFSADTKATLKGLTANQYLLQLIAANDLCTDTLRQMIYVDKQEGIFFVQDRQAMCVGESVHINLPIQPVNLTTLSWKLGTHHYQTDQFEDVSSAFDSPGVFPIMLTAQFRACPDTSYRSEVQVYPAPDVYLGQDSTLCYRGNSITLKNLLAKPVTLRTNLWSTGDTTASIKVTASGIYSLTQTDGAVGCSGTGSITIGKDCFTQMPNAFTPNNDGINDYFFPRQYLSRSVETFKLQIYNRWGQVVYETNSTEGRGWDGCFNRKAQPQGVYIYRVEITMPGLQREVYEASITLIR